CTRDCSSDYCSSMYSRFDIW
nr:immunoglobulin heavy chain junction region [Macaca mulatta]MOV47779.1 immunoglobulin heavy chain junction region [Macaca mulatta]MOV47797.1 immunoglobulin heavy chain junction region [Macaca mulatta]MOV47897.1 immunoglobulin heavy chain junction region [Macaca mulatta]MOV48112.1 immunoglobulin heavy chain junction region [Macaca mulatta]